MYYINGHCIHFRWLGGNKTDSFIEYQRFSHPRLTTILIYFYHCSSRCKHVMLCAVWNHLYNLKNVKQPWRNDTFSKVAGFSLQLY